MHSNMLTGKFPAKLLDLTDLSELRLSNNSFRYSTMPQQTHMLDMTPKCTNPPPPPLAIEWMIHIVIQWNAVKDTKLCTVTQMQNKLTLGHTLSTCLCVCL